MLYVASVFWEENLSFVPSVVIGSISELFGSGRICAGEHPEFPALLVASSRESLVPQAVLLQAV